MSRKNRKLLSCSVAYVRVSREKSSPCAAEQLGVIRVSAKRRNIKILKHYLDGDEILALRA